MNHDRTKPIVLFAVLNWGLGHASRSIPIINALLNKSLDVVICSDGIALELLRKEFPNLKYEQLPSYNISYKFESIVQNILWHIKDILLAVNKEKKIIEQLKIKYNASAIVSDNRYGCYLDNSFSAIISHQLTIQSDPKWKGQFASNVLNKFVNKFSACWIPDVEGPNSLAGELSKNKSIPNKKYIGCLSRFESITEAKKFDIAIVLSGPEPARTNLETILADQAKGLNKTIALVRGTNLERTTHLNDFNGEIFDLCLGAELNKIICQSEIIICRSGYSSLMDLMKVEKKAILIPTPGQTEQEYLAKNLMASGVAYSCDQKDFELNNAILASQKFSGFKIIEEENFLEEVVEEFLVKILV